MTDIHQAREWADRWAGKGQHIPTEAQAAIDLIKSLPDSWVDAENVQAMIDNYKHARDSNAEGTEGWVINHLMVSNLESLIPTPSLPTLADMTAEEREACKWMQADVKLSEGGSVTCVIADPRVPGAKVRVWAPHGGSDDVEEGRVTPLPGEPKLEWPGSEVVETPALPEDERIESWHEIASHKFFSDCYRDGVLIDHMIKKLDEVVDAEVVEEPETVDAPPAEKVALPRPEDVPPNEPWLIEVDNVKAIGTRYESYAVTPWAVAALNGLFARNYGDSEVTLIHKLVPEPPALPEGMRLADHAEHGRVVTSPRVDDDDDYKLFLLTEKARTGSGFAFAHESTLNFLGGEPDA